MCAHTPQCTHSHIPTASSHGYLTDTEAGLHQESRRKREENRTAKRKEKGKDILNNPTCFYKQTRKWKGKSLYRALAYPISDFSGGEKLRQVADSIEKPRERDAGEETDGGREGRERVQNNRYEEKNVTYFDGFN